MSGRNERPENHLFCPKCLERGTKNCLWCIYVGDGDIGNWGMFYVKDHIFQKYFLNSYIGLPVSRIKCTHKFYDISHERHVFTRDDDIFWVIMKEIGFIDGEVL